MDFPEFDKTARLSRDCTITEKIDGTNALVAIGEDMSIRVGSRTRWIVPGDDNYGFAKWVTENQAELLRLGPGLHYGEWWGMGIQKGHGNQPKTFSLFNTARWSDDAVRPVCCSVVPVLYEGLFSTDAVDAAITKLRSEGSIANPGMMNPEGVVVWHHAARTYFKKTLHKDEQPKGKQ